MTANTKWARSLVKFKGFPLKFAQRARLVTAESLWIVDDMDTPSNVTAKDGFFGPTNCCVLKTSPRP